MFKKTRSSVSVRSVLRHISNEIFRARLLSVLNIFAEVKNAGKLTERKVHKTPINFRHVKLLSLQDRQIAIINMAYYEVMNRFAFVCWFLSLPIGKTRLGSGWV